MAVHPVKALKSTLVVILLCTTSLLADVVEMRNGQRYYGKILTQTPKSILIRTKRKTITIPKKSIRRIRYESVAASEKARLARLRRIRALRRKREAERRARLAAANEKLQRQLAEAAQLAYRKQQAEARGARAAYIRSLIARGRLKKDDVDEPIGYWDFAWRSLLLPGWGHYKMKKPLVAMTYGVGFVYLLAQTARYRAQARQAEESNKRDVELNVLLYANLSAVNESITYLLAADANRKLLTEYGAKVERYNASLATLALFYGVQLLHIIYNGLAWEKGQVVHGQEATPPVRYALDVYPEWNRDGETEGTRGEFRATFSF